VQWLAIITARARSSLLPGPLGLSAYRVLIARGVPVQLDCTPLKAVLPLISKACSACPSGGYSLVAPMMWKAAKSCASVDVPTAGMVQPHCKALQSAYEVWPVGLPEATSTVSVLGEVAEKLVAVRATLCTFPQDVSASGLVFAPKAKPSIPKAILGYRYEKSSLTKSRSTRKGRGYYAPSFFS